MAHKGGIITKLGNDNMDEFFTGTHALQKMNICKMSCSLSSLQMVILSYLCRRGRKEKPYGGFGPAEG